MGISQPVIRWRGSEEEQVKRVINCKKLYPTPGVSVGPKNTDR